MNKFMCCQVRSDGFGTRTSALAGLRSIVQYVFQNGIEKLTIPLLLVMRYHAEACHDDACGDRMSICAQEMNQRWCLKRAELVLKCVKGAWSGRGRCFSHASTGFIMENSLFASSKAKTFQFMLPAVRQGATEHSNQIIPCRRRRRRCLKPSAPFWPRSTGCP